MTGVTRREFLKRGAAGAGALYVSSLGFDVSVAKATTIKQGLRIEGATVSHSLCPYCAVGCSSCLHTLDDKATERDAPVVQIEGDPDSPDQRRDALPEGRDARCSSRSRAARLKPLVPRARQRQVGGDHLGRRARQARPPASRTRATRRSSRRTRRATSSTACEGIAFAGGAAFSSEEGYLAAKLMRALGVVYIEQQARV